MKNQPDQYQGGNPTGNQLEGPDAIDAGSVTSGFFTARSINAGILGFWFFFLRFVNLRFSAPTLHDKSWEGSI